MRDQHNVKDDDNAWLFVPWITSEFLEEVSMPKEGFRSMTSVVAVGCRLRRSAIARPKQCQVCDCCIGRFDVHAGIPTTPQPTTTWSTEKSGSLLGRVTKPAFEPHRLNKKLIRLLLSSECVCIISFVYAAQGAEKENVEGKSRKAALGIPAQDHL